MSNTNNVDGHNTIQDGLHHRDVEFVDAEGMENALRTLEGIPLKDLDIKLEKDQSGEQNQDNRDGDRSFQPHDDGYRSQRPYMDGPRGGYEDRGEHRGNCDNRDLGFNRGSYGGDRGYGGAFAPHVFPLEEGARALFRHFQNTEPPKSYGAAYSLPAGLQFLFASPADPAAESLIVRECYYRILNVILKKIRGCEGGGGALLFTGGQGNGKTWLSLYIVWLLVHQRHTVVYECRELDIVYVIRTDGHMYCSRCPANMVTVVELAEKGTIHVFDAKASCAAIHAEPALSPQAFLIQTSLRNPDNYRQTSRRLDLESYCVPSYTTEELLQYCHLFNLNEEEVKRRCWFIGPSIRYVLVSDFEDCLQKTEAVARSVSPYAMDRYIDNTLQGDPQALSACLVLAEVREEDHFDCPEDAYREKNVEWSIASKHLTRLTLTLSRDNTTDSAMS